MPAIVAQTIDLSQWTAGEDGKVRGKDKPGNLGGGPSLILEDWSTGASFTMINTKPLWEQYGEGEHGDCVFSVDPTETVNGVPVIVQTMDAEVQALYGGVPRWGAPYFDLAPHNGSRWQYFSEVAENYNSPAQDWVFDTYDRAEFFVKLPPEPQITRRPRSRENFIAGTYFSARSAGGPTMNSGEIGGTHGYHLFNLRPGVWNKVILDHHPHHYRSTPGDLEHGNQEYPTIGQMPNDAPYLGQYYNMFDAFTRIYWETNGGGPGQGANVGGTIWKWGPLKFYQNLYAEDLENLHSLSGAYDAATNIIDVSWRRRKDDAVTPFEVRYSFFNIHQIGWGNALPAPSGASITPPEGGGYAGVGWETDQINVSGQTRIFVGIRRTDQPTTNFRQIDIPLNMGSN